MMSRCLEVVDEGGWTGAVTGYVAEESSSVVGESGHVLYDYVGALLPLSREVRQIS